VERPVWAAVAGAAATVLINGRTDATHHAVHLRPGDRLEVVTPPTGLRSYLAVRGGIDVPSVLGSRSTDLLSDLGPTPLQPGTRLPVGRTPQPFPHIGLVRTPPVQTPLEVHLAPGPRADWLTEEGLRSLADQVWTVSNDSDRTGVRLQGAPLERLVRAELPSEGIIRGAVQVPPTGLPLIFGPDHPVTGGYPVVGVVPENDCDRVAQLRPGDGLRFRWRATPATDRQPLDSVRSTGRSHAQGPGRQPR
jgi:biotin-dependent carboxylase-like uncharacterized protein